MVFPIINTVGFSVRVPDPQYTNTGGTGDRTSIITVTASGMSGDLSTLVDGTTGTYPIGWDGPTSQPAAGRYIQFQFNGSKVINEAKLYASGAGTHGTFQWYGNATSMGGAGGTAIGATFTLTAANPSATQTSMSANTAGYTYYELRGISGNTVNNRNYAEFEFKIDDA